MGLITKRKERRIARSFGKFSILSTLRLSTGFREEGWKHVSTEKVAPTVKWSELQEKGACSLKLQKL